MLNKAVAHPDANLRVDVLALLCETRRATEEFDGGELEVLKGFWGLVWIVRVRSLGREYKFTFYILFLGACGMLVC